MSQSKLEATIDQVATDLMRPAGEAAQFASIDSIRENHLDFVIACHKTWKRWHEEAVHQILFFDAFARREKSHPIGHGTQEFADYNRAVWRRVNDAIVWSIFGAQRHMVKRLCLYRPRSYLSESNAQSAMSAVAALNEDPLSIALWNDATSCVDIGDVIYVEDGRLPRPEFIELKEGHVNAEYWIWWR